MNLNDSLDAKREAKKLAYEKDRRIAKRIIQYILFYLAVIFILSIVSFLFDLIFYKIDYGPASSPSYFLLQYTGFFMIIGYWIFPLSLLYNFIINTVIPLALSIRILTCILMLLFYGFLINDHYEFGYYIGKYRQIKNVIAAVLSGTLIEVIRNWVVHYRMKNRSNPI